MLISVHWTCTGKHHNGQIQSEAYRRNVVEGPEREDVEVEERGAHEVWDLLHQIVLAHHRGLP